MAWLNVAAQRSALWAVAQKSLAAWSRENELVGNHKFELVSLLSGDTELRRKARPFSEKWLSYYAGKPDAVLAQPNVFASYANLALLAWIAGGAADNLERAAALKFRANPSQRALQLLLARIVDGDASTSASAAARRIDTEAEWLRALSGLPVERAFDLALCPDHRMWTMTLSDFCIPLAVLVHRARSTHSIASFEDYMALGASPERVGNIVFERQSPRPQMEQAVADDLLGFDAIKREQQEFVVYHWLGFEWQATMDFAADDTLNAFRSLRSLDRSWALVRQQMGARRWREIETAVAAGHCKHVIVHAHREHAGAAKAASTFYGVPVSAAHLDEL